MRPLGYLVLLLGLVTTVALASCKNYRESALQAAQICLDKTAPSDAMKCYEMVAGDSSQGAYRIRCSALLIHERVSFGELLKNALDRLKGGDSSVIKAMSFLAFKASGGTRSDSTDLEKARLATVDCGLSGSPGLSMISALACVSTAISAHLTSFDSSIAQPDISKILASLPEIPRLLQSTHQRNCEQNVSQTYELYCKQYSAALAATKGSSLAETAAYFLLNLK